MGTRFSHTYLTPVTSSLSVETEQVLPRFERGEVKTYAPKSVKDLRESWVVEHIRELFRLEPLDFLEEIRAFEVQRLEDLLQYAWTHNAHSYGFYIFEVMSLRASEGLVELNQLRHWLGIDPAMVYALLKVYMVQEEGQNIFRGLDDIIVESIIASANTYSISAPMTLERLRPAITGLDFRKYSDIMWLTACSVRSLALASDILATLVETRSGIASRSRSLEYAHRHVWAVCLDRAEDADSECPCTDDGRPRRQKKAPPKVPLKKTDEERVVDAQLRIDSPTHVKLHSHVRLQAASQPERGVDPRGRPIMDGVVSGSRRGELRIHLLHTPPIDLEDIEWYLYPAGDIVTSRAMFDSVVKLQVAPNSSTALHQFITGDHHVSAIEHETSSEEGDSDQEGEGEAQPASDVPLRSTWSIDETVVDWSRFNESQKEAICSITYPLSLIWGPPG